MLATHDTALLMSPNAHFTTIRRLGWNECTFTALAGSFHVSHARSWNPLLTYRDEGYNTPSRPHRSNLGSLESNDGSGALLRGHIVIVAYIFGRLLQCPALPLVV